MLIPNYSSIFVEDSFLFYISVCSTIGFITAGPVGAGIAVAEATAIAHAVGLADQLSGSQGSAPPPKKK